MTWTPLLWGGGKEGPLPTDHGLVVGGCGPHPSSWFVFPGFRGFCSSSVVSPGFSQDLRRWPLQGLGQGEEAGVQSERCEEARREEKEGVKQGGVGWRGEWQ